MIEMMPSERSVVARAARMNEQYLYQCLTGRRSTPSERCPLIERATDARITCEELRPDVTWSRIPDAGWPHPDGRPVIDVARPNRSDKRVGVLASHAPTVGATELDDATRSGVLDVAGVGGAA